MSITMHDCVTCGASLRFYDGAEVADAELGNLFFCKKCCPKGMSYVCTVCSEEKDEHSFPSRRRRGGLDIRRCYSCTERCSACAKLCGSGKMFADNSSMCWACFEKSQTVLCGVQSCRRVLPKDCFDKNILSHAKQRVVVCKSCESVGCSPKDIQMYECVTGHTCGHLKFDRHLLHNWKRDHTSILRCRDCNNQCDVCKKYQGEDAFDKHVLEHCKNHKRRLVCLRCAREGFSVADVDSYLCLGGHKCGHMKFDRQTLKNWKRRADSRLLCSECNTRERVILAKLREKGSWRCNCRTFKNNRAHAALYANSGHQERCMLFRVFAGKERWDGGNKNVTKDDLEFLVKIKGKY